MHCMQKIKFNVQKCFLYLSAVPFVPWTRGWRVFVEQGCQSLSVQVMRGYFPKNVQSTFVTKYIHYPSKWIRQTKVKTWILWSFSDGEVIFFNLLSVKKCAGVFMWEIFCFPILFFDFFQLAAWSFSLPKTSCLGLCYWPQNARLIFLSLEKYFAAPKCISLKYQ